MGCSKCGNNSCNGCNGNGQQSAQTASDLQNQVASLQDTVDQITANAGFLLCGHPILMIETKDDIDQFDLSSGIGSGCWEGWGICNGNQYTNATTKKKITSPNLRDRFIVGAGGAYSVDDTGGVDSVQLTAAQNGSHTHTITDPGHSHNISDPGHDHPISDPGHNHGASSAPHGHTLSINPDGNHNHKYAGEVDQISNAGVGAFAWDGVTLSNTSVDGIHSHAGSTADNATVVVTVSNAFTGVDVTNAFTGITQTDDATTGISINSSGAGDPHENRPPYFALLFVIKI